jgi:hypothetical protein
MKYYKNLNTICLRTLLKQNKDIFEKDRIIRAINKIQVSKMISKNKLCKLKDRILYRRGRKLPYDSIISIRRFILRTCFIQSLIDVTLRM